MSRPDKDAYLSRYKGQRRRRLNVPEEGINTEDQLIEYINKCEVMVDTIIVFEQIRDEEMHRYFRNKAQDLYEETKDELFKTGDLVDEDKMMEPFKQKLITMIKDYFSKNNVNESKEVKEYRYITNHGVGPGMCPEGIFIRSEDLDSGKTAVYFNRPLSDEELKKYDIKPEWIQESKETITINSNEDLIDMLGELLDIDLEMDEDSGEYTAERGMLVSDIADGDYAVYIEELEEMDQSNPKVITCLKYMKSLNENKLTESKYKITYYKNSAAAERRPTTKEDIEEDWVEEEREYPLDVEAYEYVFKEILDNDDEDLTDLYEDLQDPNDDLEKIHCLQDYFDSQDLGDGSPIIVSIEGPGQNYDSGFDKSEIEYEDDELDENCSLQDATIKTMIKEGIDWSYYDKFKEVNDIYLPDEGEGDTLASQIVTAVNKLVYKWYNDGDVYDNVNSGMQGWANDLSSYANWLNKYCLPAKRILDSIFNCSSDDIYEEILKKLADKCLDPNYLVTMEEPKQGSIYECDGPFEFSEYDEDDDWNEDEIY